MLPPVDKDDINLNQIKSAIGLEPFHEEKAGLIYCRDCLEVMKNMPDNCVDLVVTDPPYGINFETWDIIDCLPVFSEFKRIATANSFILIFGSIRNAPEFLKVCVELGIFRRWITWAKPRTAHIVSEGLIWQTDIIIMCKKGKPFVKKGFHPLYRDFIEFPIVQNGDGDYTGHKAQKPVELLTMLVDKYSQPGDLILDPFLGSGTTAVAAKMLHRNFIGIEISPKYCEIARQRLGQEVLF